MSTQFFTKFRSIDKSKVVRGIRGRYIRKGLEVIDTVDITTDGRMIHQHIAILWWAGKHMSQVEAMKNKPWHIDGTMKDIVARIWDRASSTPTFTFLIRRLPSSIPLHMHLHISSQRDRLIFTSLENRTTGPELTWSWPIEPLVG